MQFRRSVGPGVLIAVLLLTAVLLAVVVWRFPEWLGIRSGSDRQGIWLECRGDVSASGVGVGE